MADARALARTRAQRLAARGVVLFGARTGATLLATFAGSVALMRILGPQEFGVFAVLQFALTFLQLFGDAGLGAALVQRKAAPSDRELGTVFTFQLLLSALLVALAWIAAPRLGVIWPHLPATAWTLLRAMSLSLLVTSLRTVPSILLERELRFGAIAAAETLQVVVFYSVAVALAVGPARAWTWPAALLAQALAGAAFVCAAQPWRPRAALDVPVLRRLVRFGVPFQLKSFIGFANGAVTPLYAGAVLGATAVGLVSWAQQLAYLPLKVVEIVGRVAFPLLSRLQDDREALPRVLDRAVQAGAAATFFTSALLLTIGPNVTSLVFSDAWLGGLVALRAFAAALTIGFVSPLVAAALDAVGRPAPAAKLAAGWTALNWVVVPFATARWGFDGFAIGYCVHVVVGNAALLAVLPSIVPGTRLRRSVLAPAVAGGAVAAIGWLVLRPWATTLPRLCVGVAAALATYLATVAIVDPSAVRALRRLLPRRDDAPRVEPT